jgi:formylglycine-generating enzyme required for sulfatase activity
MNRALKITLIILIIFIFVDCRGRKNDKNQKQQAEVGSAGMVRIPAGVFKTGSDSGTELEAPERLVTTEEYWIDKFEYPNILGEMPLVNATWYEAREKCLEQGKDLPTERQWEKACRGPEGFVYPYGNEYDKRKCRTELSWNDGPAASGTYRDCVSGYGVYDMSGNVMEWTLGESVEERAVRGGYWQNIDFYTRCSYRVFYHPTYAAPNIGFRCVKSSGKIGKVPIPGFQKATTYWARLKRIIEEEAS